jgi:hypothetical protein
MDEKVVAIRPLPQGFEPQPPPSLEILREMAQIRELKERLLAARRLKLAN